jgi:hypothetical protein
MKPGGTTAKARLAAAAPLLLATLKVVTQLARRQTSAPANRRPDRRVMLTLCAIAEAAIATAEGRDGRS